MDRTVSITAHRQGDGKELVGYSYTLPSSLSMPKRRVEAAWKQAKRSLEYGYSMAKVLLYPSFGAPLVFLWSTYGDSEMARNGFEDGSKRHVMMNLCGMSLEVVFVALRTCFNVIFWK